MARTSKLGPETEKMVETTKTTKPRAKKEEAKTVEAVSEVKNPTDEEIAEILKSDKAQAMISEMIAKAIAAQPTVQNFVAVPTKEEMVTLLYMGEVPEGTTVYLGKLGEMQGRGGTRDIPKKEFFQNITTPVLRRLKDRRLVVLNGLTDDERDRYGVNYTDGELLDVSIYQKLFELDIDKICEIFDKACYRHKKIIVSMIIDAYELNDPRVTQSLVSKLNTISKKTDPEGMLRAVLKDMAQNLSDS